MTPRPPACHERRRAARLFRPRPTGRPAEERLVRSPKLHCVSWPDLEAGSGRPVLASQHDRAREGELHRPAARDDAAGDRSEVRLGAPILHARSEVDLLVVALYFEVAHRAGPVAAIRIKQTAEHRGRVEPRDAPPVDGAAAIDERGRMAVGQEPVVGDRRLSPPGAQQFRRSHSLGLLSSASYATLVLPSCRRPQLREARLGSPWATLPEV